MSNICDNRICMSAKALYLFLHEYWSPEGHGCFELGRFKEDSGFESIGVKHLSEFNYSADELNILMANPENHEKDVHLTFVSHGQSLAAHALAFIAKRYGSYIEYIYADTSMENSGQYIFNADGSMVSHHPIPLYDALVNELGFDEDYVLELGVLDTCDYVNTVAYTLGRLTITKSFLLIGVPSSMSLEHVQMVGHIAYEANQRNLKDVGIDFFMSIFDQCEPSNEVSSPVKIEKNGVKRIPYIESLNIQKSHDAIGFNVFSYAETIDLMTDLITHDVEENCSGDIQEVVDQINANAAPLLKMVLLYVIETMTAVQE